MATLHVSSIVDMNTKAIARAQQNNLDVAIKSFGRALACLFELVGTKKDSNVHRKAACNAKKMYSRTEFTDVSESIQTTIVESVSIDYPQSHTETNYVSTSPDNSFKFYNKAFVPTSFSANEEAHDSVMTSILLYNMALTYHIKAVQTGATKALYSALKLYRMSFDVVQGNSDFSCDMRDLLLLALINNMGFIHSHFYDWDKMKNSQEVLHSLFMAACDISTNLETEDCIFFSYVLSPHYQISSVSPAA